MDARGRISRGKATFFTRFALSTTDLDPELTEVENRFQASSPDRRYTGKYGMLAPSTLVTNEKTARYTIGFSNDQTAPSTEAAYFTFNSRRMRLSSTSRRAAISRRRVATRSLGGSDVRRTISELVPIGLRCAGAARCRVSLAAPPRRTGAFRPL